MNSLAYADGNVLLVQQDRLASALKQAINVTVTVSSTSVWEREQIIIKVDITTPDLFAGLQLESFRIKGLDSYPISPTTSRIQINGKKYARLQAGWVMYPIADGSYEIRLPDIQYELNGVIRDTIPIPVFSVKAKALPAYIPPTLPVGTIAIESHFPDKLINTNTLAYWKLSLKGNGLPAQWLPAVLRQLKNNDDIRYSPVTSERSNMVGVNGMQSQVTHTIPLKALTNGALNLPTLRVQYFDPADGRLKTLVIEKTHGIYALSYGWRAVILLVLGGLLYMIVKQLGEYGHRRWLKRKRINLAVDQISRSTTLHDIRSALNQLALAENWPDNLSISAWYCLWNSKYRHQPDLDNLLNNLSIACYSKQHIEPGPDYRNRLISCLTNTKTL